MGYGRFMGYAMHFPAHQLGGHKMLWDKRGYGFAEVWVKRGSTVVDSHHRTDPSMYHIRKVSDYRHITCVIVRARAVTYACRVLQAPLVVEQIFSKFLMRFERLSSEGGGKLGNFQLRSHGQEPLLSPSLQPISFPCPCMSFLISVL